MGYSGVAIHVPNQGIAYQTNKIPTAGGTRITGFDGYITNYAYPFQTGGFSDSEGFLPCTGMIQNPNTGVIIRVVDGYNGKQSSVYRSTNYAENQASVFGGTAPNQVTSLQYLSEVDRWFLGYNGSTSFYSSNDGANFTAMSSNPWGNSGAIGFASNGTSVIATTQGAPTLPRGCVSISNNVGVSFSDVGFNPPGVSINPSQPFFANGKYHFYYSPGSFSVSLCSSSNGVDWTTRDVAADWPNNTTPVFGRNSGLRTVVADKYVFVGSTSTVAGTYTLTQGCRVFPLSYFV
jgi:hypothetical protein